MVPKKRGGAINHKTKVCHMAPSGRARCTLGGVELLQQFAETLQGFLAPRNDLNFC
jgi:hypothetical protein